MARNNLTKTKPQNSNKWYRMETDSNDDVTEVFLYDGIGGWFGVEASYFVKELSQVTSNNIVLRVNSPGGDVYDALAIMNALKRHKAKITATVDGIAASAASFILMAADDVIMGKGSEIMIHDALIMAMGNAADMRAEADFLDRISNTIASVYTDRAGGTTEEWRERMVAETWYTAEEAVNAGLADSVVGAETDEKAATNLKSSIDFSIFAYAGRREAPTPPQNNAGTTRADITQHLTAALAVASERAESLAAPDRPAQPEVKGADVMSEELIRGVAARLGIKKEDGVELSEETVLNALDEALNEQIDEATAPPAAQSVAPGTVVLDEQQHEQLVNDAAAGRAAREQQLEDQREAAVMEAINDGRIPPARKQHWVNLLKADPEAKQTLDSLATGLVPLAETGFTGGVNESTDEDRTYSNIFPKEA